MNREIQRGKLVGMQGPGSIYIDTDGSSYIVSSVDKWYDKNFCNSYIDIRDFELHDLRLERILGVDKFLEAPDYRTTFNKSNTPNTKLEIPIARFPLLEYCSKCGTFNEARPGYSQKKRYCKECDKQEAFIQFPIVIMCKNGHIYDFPYFFYIHTNKHRSKKCSRQWIEREGASILNWTLHCNCEAEHSLTGVTGKSDGKGSSPFVNEMHGAKCFGKMPWTGDDSTHECDATPIAILKNALNVYRPETIEALSLAESTTKFEEKVSLEEIYHQEFIRLNKSFVNENDDLDKLKVEKSFETDSKKAIKSVNHVHRLQQLVVLTDFHREVPSDDFESFEKAITGPDNTLIFSDDFKYRDWYPAKKVYGEGIFIEFNSDILREWEKNEEVAQHYQNLIKRVDSFYLADKYSSPSSVLIHTLSHAIIKELSRHCGYPVTSIRERLYLENGNQGVLIYVTDPDKAGTYGGLVRLAELNKFKLILNEAVKSTDWCSSDPVCFELGRSTGQGIENSNGAACHNCCFLPSTSCGSRNCFLDRDYVNRYGSDVSITRWFDFI